MKINVSVVTVVYNDCSGIEKTIKSVIGQRPFINQYIVIDGGSSDGTRELIYKYQNDIDIIISEPDSGIYNAMNKGWNLVDNDDYILYINSSDHLEHNVLSNLHLHLHLHQDVDVYHGITKFILPDGSYYYQGRSSDNLPAKMIEHPSSLVRKSAFIRMNGFNEEYRLSSDYDFMLRLYCNNSKFKQIPIIISNFYADGGSSSGISGPIESLKIRYRHGYLSRKNYLLQLMSLNAKYLVKKYLL